MFGIRDIRLQVWLSNYYVLKIIINFVLEVVPLLIMNLLSWIYYKELRLKDYLDEVKFLRIT